MKTLIVEDHEPLARMWAETLELVGFSCTHVGSCREAMVHILRGQFEFFLLDLFVRDGNTISLSDWISARTPDAPIIMVTGSRLFSDGNYPQLAPGVSWVLHKPFSSTDLSAVAQHLAMKSRRTASDGETPASRSAQA